VGHFYSHKYPGATFVNHLVVSKIMDNEVLSLRNHEYWTITGSGEQKYDISDGEQLKTILDTRFDINVSEAEGQRLFELTA
jgi:N-hydroxyarylamine O-acetyltransferase